MISVVFFFFINKCLSILWETIQKIKNSRKDTYLYLWYFTFVTSMAREHQHKHKVKISLFYSFQYNESNH